MNNLENNNAEDEKSENTKEQSESVNDKDAFSFLNEVKNELLKNFSIDELMNTNGFQLIKGTEI